MDPEEAISSAIEFIEANYLHKLLSNKLKGKKRLTINFKKLIEFSLDLGSYVLDKPEEAFKVFKLACEKECDELPHDFNVRFKNIERHTRIHIPKIRSKDIGRLITVEGMIKQKSDVKAQITSVKFECPTCGNILSVLQLDERKFVEPSKCACGRKGKFIVSDKEEIDVYSLLIEEPTEFLTGGVRLSQIKVLCKGDLTEPEIERKLYQGIRSETTGVLKEFQLTGRSGQLTSKVDWYIEANYIKAHDESFMDLKWTKEDEKKFKALAKRPTWLADLRKSIFYDIHGYEEESEGIILQMFSGVGKTREGAKVRGNFHILLVGDPGGAKSTMLKIAQKFCPKSQYVAGAGITGVGLTASAVRDELLGGYTLEAGALVLCNNGVLMLDELDKVGDENKKALHEPLAEETVSISKANIQATLVAQTSVLAAANPKHGSYSEYDDVYSQIELSPTLINRFDLVYPIKDSKLTENDDYSIAMKILQRGMVDETKAAEFSKEFVKKYIAYAKNITPIMSEKIQNFIANKYKELKVIKRNTQNSQTIPVTGRNVDGFRRVIEAVARSRLHKNVTEEDAEIGYRKVIYSIQQVGIDPNSGDVVEVFVSGKPMKLKDIAARIIRLIREKYNNYREMMTEEELYAILSSEGIDDTLKIDEIIEKLKKSGDIFEPKPRQYKAQ